ncbi:MAG TPA: hypothetical protein ENI49_01540 [Thermoplasmatales archaeon]|nr:hypothetical protein [Thermoplasmatales archaeon]
MKNENSLIFQFLGVEYDTLITCRWRLTRPENISWETINKIREWTDNKVPLKKYANIKIRRLNRGKYPAKYELIIRGRGYDDRCTWCKSFRTALETTARKMNCTITYEKFCNFD